MRVSSPLDHKLQFVALNRDGFVEIFIPDFWSSASVATASCKPLLGEMSVQNIPQGPAYFARFAGYITLCRVYVNAYTKYLPVKSALEDLFGSDAWYALKESNHLGTWRKYADKTLRAVELSITDSVEIYDEAWLGEVSSRLQEGKEQLRLADSIDEVVGVLAGTMIEMSFIQLGHMPRRKGQPGTYPLRKGEWRLNGFRSVVYVQTKAQKEDRFLSLQRQKIGFDEQFDLMAEYRRSKSQLAYSDWCRQKEKGTAKRA